MVVCFGEVMLRLSPPGYTPLRQAGSLDVVYGGAEANVAAALSGFGLHAAMVSALADNALGDGCKATLDSFGVDTRYILRSPGRMGIYFLERGASLRASAVLYDRSGSAFSRTPPERYDWDAILRDASWVHFTGITPALGEVPQRALLDALSIAKDKHIPVSCDINYRRNLWSVEDANRCMKALLPLCDVLITNPAQVKDVLFWEEADDLALSRRLCAEFGFSAVALSGRESPSAEENVLYGSLYSAKADALFASRRYAVRVIERIGGGDAFAAGLIYGMIQNLALQETIEIAAAADAYKHTIPGDAMCAKLEDVLAVAHGESGGGLRR